MDTKFPTLKQFSERHDWPISSLRWIRFNSQNPDDERYAPYAAAFRKVGGRVHVNERQFFEILDAQGAG